MKWGWIILLPCFAFARDPFSLSPPRDDNKSVLIKARIVNVDQHYLKSLGVIFATSSTQIKTKNGLNMDIPEVKSGVGVASIPIAKFSNGNTLDLQLSALQNEGHANIIASPELIANNNQAAEIASGEEVPYQEKTGQGNTSVAFKKAVLQLKVTPQILNTHHVLLKIQLNQDNVGSLRINGVPAIRTQQIKTIVSVMNRHTIVLGGIYESVNDEQTVSVPGLSKLPLLGALFRSKEQRLERKSLLIFITPEIMR